MLLILPCRHMYGRGTIRSMCLHHVNGTHVAPYSIDLRVDCFFLKLNVRIGEISYCNYWIFRFPTHYLDSL